MKQIIRANTFETNSSTTHNMVIVPDEQYNDWTNNNLYLLKYDWSIRDFKDEFSEGNLYTLDYIKSSKWFNSEKVQEELKNWSDYSEDSINEFLQDNYFVTCDSLDEHLERDEHEYKTKSGEKLHIICSYGYDC